MARKLVVELIGDAGSLEKALRSAGKSSDDFGSKAESAAEKQKRGGEVIGTAAKIGAAAVAGLGVAAVNAAGSFEKSLNTFQSVSGATGTEMGKVSELAKKLGADVRLPGTSAKDAAAAMTELAKGGLSVRESMDAARGVLTLSAAAEIDNAEAATITARALNTFSLKGREAGRVSDILAATANASTAEITDVAQGFQTAGSAAAGLKVPIEDLSASIGIMANKGIAGSDAGTSLKTMFSALIPKSDKAAEQMKKMGLDVFDADGKFIGMRETIALYSKELGKLNPEQRQNAINTIFGSDASRAANIVLAGGVEQYDKMHKAVTKKGAADEVAAAKMKGFKGAMEGFKSTLETLAISFGTVLLPAATKAMQFLSGAFGGLEKHKTLVLVVTGVLGGLATAIYAVNLAVKIWGATTAAFTAVQAGLNTVLAMNPIGLVVLAIAGLVAAFVLAWKNSETFREIVTGAWNAIKDAAEFVFDAVKGFIVKPLGDAFTWVKNAVSDVGGWLGDQWEKYKLGAEWWWKQIKEKIITPLSEAWSWVKGAVRDVLGWLGDRWADIKLAAELAWLGFKVVVTRPVGEAISDVREKIGNVVGWLGERWEDIKSAASSAWGAFKSNIVSPVESAVGAVKGFIGKGKDGLITWLEDRKDDIEKAANKLAAPFVTAFDKMKGAVKDVVTWLGKVVDAVKDAVEWIGKIKLPKINLPDLNPLGGAGNGTTVGPIRPGLGVDSLTPIAAGFGLSMTSGFRGGDPGWHGQNRARDYSNSTGPTPQMMAFARAMLGIAPRLLELIYTPLGVGVKNGQVVPMSFFGGDVAAAHNNHVHVAMAQGGVVRARVGETGPEDVLLPTGSRVVPNWQAHGSGDVNINIGEYHAHSRKDVEVFGNKLARQVAFG